GAGCVPTIDAGPAAGGRGTGICGFVICGLGIWGLGTGGETGTRAAGGI
ncbi:hypothetical protein H4F68_24665, partial [Rhodococcus globerulus]|nr:hypothetical protein [Rhodococcus globerulus]